MKEETKQKFNVIKEVKMKEERKVYSVSDSEPSKNNQYNEKKTYVAKSGTQMHGLLANEYIKSDEFVIEYLGDSLTNKEAKYENACILQW